MSNEFNENLKIYISDLNKALEEARAKKVEFEQDEDNSKRKEKKIAQINSIIDELEEMLERATNLTTYEELQNNIDQLKASSLKTEDIKDLIDNMLSKLESDSNSILYELSIKCDLETIEDETYFINYQASLEQEIANINRDILNLSGKKLREKEKELEELENKISEVDEALAKLDENSKINASLISILQVKTRETKNKHLNKINDILNTKIEVEARKVSEDMEEFERIQKKLNAKNKNSKLTIWFKEHWKGITATVVGVALTGTLIGILAHQVKKGNSENNKEDQNQNQNTTPNKPNDQNNGTEPEPTIDPVIEALVTKGYNEYKANLMVQNFSKETIDELLLFYRPEVEKYANCQNFNLDYLDDYDFVINKYQVTANKAIDYINRSYQIATTNFYEGASIEDIVKVVMSIDNKDLYKYENGALAQSFNTAFNPIVNNFLFGTVKEEDINKIDALQYLAENGTDMNNFLTTYGNLVKNVLSNPNDQSAKDRLFNFINIFALSFAGYSNEDLEKVLSNDEQFNQDAIVIDYVDWFVAYNSFIAPLYPINAPVTPVEPKKPVIPEGANEAEIAKINAEYELALAEFKIATLNYNEQFKKISDVQYLMNSALASPEFGNICGEDLSR